MPATTFDYPLPALFHVETRMWDEERWAVHWVRITEASLDLYDETSTSIPAERLSHHRYFITAEAEYCRIRFHETSPSFVPPSMELRCLSRKRAEYHALIAALLSCQHRSVAVTPSTLCLMCNAVVMTLGLCISLLSLPVMVTANWGQIVFNGKPYQPPGVSGSPQSPDSGLLIGGLIIGLLCTTSMLAMTKLVGDQGRWRWEWQPTLPLFGASPCLRLSPQLVRMYRRPHLRHVPLWPFAFLPFAGFVKIVAFIVSPLPFLRSPDAGLGAQGERNLSVQALRDPLPAEPVVTQQSGPDMLLIKCLLVFGALCAVMMVVLKLNLPGGKRWRWEPYRQHNDDDHILRYATQPYATWKRGTKQDGHASLTCSFLPPASKVSFRMSKIRTNGKPWKREGNNPSPAMEYRFAVTFEKAPLPREESSFLCHEVLFVIAQFVRHRMDFLCACRAFNAVLDQEVPFPVLCKGRAAVRRAVVVTSQGHKYLLERELNFGPRRVRKIEVRMDNCGSQEATEISLSSDCSFQAEIHEAPAVPGIRLKVDEV